MEVSTAILVAKSAVTALSDDKVRKGVFWTIGLTLSPFIVVIILIFGLLSGTANHNDKAVDLCFNGGATYGKVPKEYKDYITQMQKNFSDLDEIIAKINLKTENQNSLDSTRVKAIFYAINFGTGESFTAEKLRAFANCFVTREVRSRQVTETDSTGKTIIKTEDYTVNVPIKELEIVYQNIEKTMGTKVSEQNEINATEIYYRVLFGKPAPTYGAEFDEWSNSIKTSDEAFKGTNGFYFPTSKTAVVTSEFGYRKDPFTGKPSGHSGMDFGALKGTPIYSALDGTVYVVRFSNTGYGYHLMIDHGGGFVTLYGHCSKILVKEGQKVKGGDKIAEVGTTGRSTGNHLHFEVRINGEKQNPRNYLS